MQWRSSFRWRQSGIEGNIWSCAVLDAKEKMRVRKTLFKILSSAFLLIGPSSALGFLHVSLLLRCAWPMWAKNYRFLISFFGALFDMFEESWRGAGRIMITAFWRVKVALLGEKKETVLLLLFSVNYMSCIHAVLYMYVMCADFFLFPYSSTPAIPIQIHILFILWPIEFDRDSLCGHPLVVNASLVGTREQPPTSQNLPLRDKPFLNPHLTVSGSILGWQWTGCRSSEATATDVSSRLPLCLAILYILLYINK